MKRNLMVFTAIASLVLPLAAPVVAAAQDRGGRSQRERVTQDGEGRAQRAEDRGGRDGRGGSSESRDRRQGNNSPPRPAEPPRPDRPTRPDPSSRPDQTGPGGGQDRGRGQGRGGGQTGGQPGGQTGGQGRDRSGQDRGNRPAPPTDRGDRPGRPDGRGAGGQDGRDNRTDGRQDRRDYRSDGRQDRRDDRGGGRQDRRDYRSDGRRDRQDDRRGDRRDDRGDRREDRREYREFRNRFDSNRWRSDWNRSHRSDWWRNDHRFRSYTGFRIGFYFAPGYGYYSVPRSYWGQRWTVGDYLPSLFWRYQLDDWRTFGLGYPPAGTRWVVVDNQIYLIDQYDGYIIDVIYDAWSW
jgi:Ni/Co efflux regulator RcnB